MEILNYSFSLSPTTAYEVASPGECECENVVCQCLCLLLLVPVSICICICVSVCVYVCLCLACVSACMCLCLCPSVSICACACVSFCVYFFLSFQKFTEVCYTNMLFLLCWSDGSAATKQIAQLTKYEKGISSACSVFQTNSFQFSFCHYLFKIFNFFCFY